VTVSGYALGGTNHGYILTQPSGFTADITAANLNVTGLSANDRAYDTTTTAALSGTAGITVLGADAVTLNGTAAGNFADKNVGTAKAVTVSGLSITGADAGNYTLVVPTSLTADITAANLNVTGLSTNNKVYDTTTTAALSGTAGITALGADVVTLNGTAAGNFADKNVGTAKAVTVSGLSITGADAGNYTLVVPTSLTADITAANLNVTGLSANDKVYDATTTAALSGTAGITALGADVVTLNGTGSANFSDKNVGLNKAVAVSGYSISGADAGNYTLVQPSGLTADITVANLNVTGLSANDKVYDTTTTAALSGTAGITALGADVVTLNGTAAGNFADKNVGTAKAVTVSGLSITGADAGNYTLVVPTSLTADITQRALTIASFTADDKVFDGTTSATISSYAFDALQGSDTISVSGIGGDFDTSAIGTGKTVTLSAGTLAGADAANYSFTLGAATDFASILSDVQDTGTTTTAEDLPNTLVVLTHTPNMFSASGGNSGPFDIVSFAQNSVGNAQNENANSDEGQILIPIQSYVNKFFSGLIFMDPELSEELDL
jgi:trimeric autotransporter adhesin